MYSFKVPQKKFLISGVSFGGSPGERPTVMVGSIFYAKHKIVKDITKGEFDKAEAEKQVNLQKELSDKTGLPSALDVIASTPQSMERFLRFSADVFDGPLFMDGSTDDVRAAGAELASQWGLSNRIIYNSVTPDSKESELDKIRATNTENCVILAYVSTSFTSHGRIKAVNELIPKLEQRGVTRTLIDTCVIDVPSLGSASRALFEIKQSLGLPVGNGSHNAISTWRGREKKFGFESKRPAVAAAAAITAAVGGDYCLYGPLHTAPDVFPVVAMVNAAQEQLGLEDGEKPNRALPLFKIG